jgi:hypothetical protein
MSKTNGNGAHTKRVVIRLEVIASPDQARENLDTINNLIEGDVEELSYLHVKEEVKPIFLNPKKVEETIKAKAKKSYGNRIDVTRGLKDLGLTRSELLGKTTKSGTRAHKVKCAIRANEYWAAKK